MEAEEYYQTNYRAVHNTMFKENQKIKQFDFNDMVDFATQFSQSQNKELTEQLEKERESDGLTNMMIKVSLKRKKVFKVAHIRGLERKVSLGKISYSRMVETLNDMAYEVYNPIAEFNKRSSEILEYCNCNILEDTRIHCMSCDAPVKK